MSSPTIIHLSPNWVVVNKPSGWLTIPPSPRVNNQNEESATSETESNTEDDATSQAAPILVEWVNKNHGPVWVVHRLDKDTTGIILFARSAEDHQKTSVLFQDRKIKKIYHCLSSGEPKEPVYKLDAPIRGQKSVSQFEVLEKYEEGFLAQVRPVTGRRHQIRMHLSGVGFPIWGDSAYGGKSHQTVGSRSFDVPRVALHAARLELPGGVKFEAPWPNDFAFWVDSLRTEGKKCP